LPEIQQKEISKAKTMRIGKVIKRGMLHFTAAYTIRNQKDVMYAKLLTPTKPTIGQISQVITQTLMIILGCVVVAIGGMMDLLKISQDRK